MISTEREEATLKLHMVGDQLWAACGLDTPRAILSESLTRDDIVNNYTTLRLLGTRHQASLLLRLQQLTAESDTRLEVASPRLCHNMEELQDPGTVMLRMRQCVVPASIGGWHEFNCVDEMSYRIAAKISHPYQQGVDASRLVEAHALSKPLSFIDTLDLLPLAYVLATVRDPRWYVNPEIPTRLTMFKSALGLNTSTVRQVLSNEILTIRHIRCQAMIQCWHTVTPSLSDFERPGNFLWRVARSHADEAYGVLRATQAFATYLFWTWQQLIADNRRTGQQLEMFIPELFFKGAEVEAYHKHLAKYSA